jgi:hypothetical protein
MKLEVGFNITEGGALRNEDVYHVGCVVVFEVGQSLSPVTPSLHEKN